jgi:hypothetical protein
MPSYGQPTTVSYVAWNNTEGNGQPGDKANHSLLWLKDGVKATPTNIADIVEVDPVVAPGVYTIVMTGPECQCGIGTLCGSSSTPGVTIFQSSIGFENLPIPAPNSAGGLATIGTGSGQINPSGGKLPATLASGDVSGNLAANVIQWRSGNVPATNVSGVPVVDVGYSAGTQAFNHDGIIASATTNTVTFPGTDAAGAQIPDDVRYEYSVLQIVGGTGTGQTVLLTTKAGIRSFNVQSGTMPVPLGNDSKYIVLGSWRSSNASTTVTVGGFVNGAITTGAFAPGAVDSTIFAQSAADRIWASTTRSLTDKAGFQLAPAEHTAIAGDVWNATRASYAGVGTFGQGVASVQGNVVGSVQGVVSGVVVASLGTGAITGASFAAGAIDAGVFAQTAADKVWATAVRALTDKANFTLAGGEHTQISTDVWGAARASFTSVGTFGQGVASVQGNLTGNVGGNVVGSVASVAGAVTVGAYSSGQDPGTYVLLNPANKIAAAATTGYVSANVIQWRSGNVPNVNITGVPVVDVGYVVGLPLYILRGAANAGGANTITLDNNAPADCSVYVGRQIKLHSGNGHGQVRFIISASGRVVTVHKPWVQQPASGTVYEIGDLSEANLNLDQPVPLTNTAHSAGDALNAARAVGFGPMRINKSLKTIVYYASDGTTQLRSFSVDDSNRPTRRD